MQAQAHLGEKQVHLAEQARLLSLLSFLAESAIVLIREEIRAKDWVGEEGLEDHRHVACLPEIPETSS